MNNSIGCITELVNFNYFVSKSEQAVTCFVTLHHLSQHHLPCNFG